MYLEPIAFAKTPFSQKFGIPRQGAGLSKARGEIHFAKDIDPILACDGLMQFSHCWLLFEFHAHRPVNSENRSKHLQVRPPRLGGNKKIGVFASRSSFRPNRIGMSLVKVLKLENNILYVQGIDLLTHTPIIDIKPYIVYSDSLPDATSDYAQVPPEIRLQVKFDEHLNHILNEIETRHPGIVELAEDIISYDPRPAYKAAKQDDKVYHLRLYEVEFHFIVRESSAYVNNIT
uniref:tRNA (N6-threonylcarbamoyladenosine(37)-N6)-methyltransferase TrmO n=1 Tax=Ningiella ruwaisensis TaxID=2364274 RepID=UPI00109FD51C|nr:tRNA (N6-threonylcarbamoyladenosine(37)-N6)-methyltransferase TrmO [Ningiella ruwaisensis]